ncbi:MAG TPA: SDR family oxidoreductase [Candidatus Nanoarchaeia archaeon]|nr:SDR family oxidoreductase [Candidatus Nanoarchaeia archaeon]
MAVKAPVRKVAAITGAYSGLGASLSRALLREGYRLVLGGKDAAQQKAFLRSVKRDGVIALVMDVRIKSDCEKFISAAKRSFGRLDLLVNNAGTWRMAPIGQVTEQDIRDIFETNVFGPIYTSQAAVKIMKKQGSGHILNIGSTAAVEYKTSHVAYGASKAAIIGFTGCLRTELQDTGIRVSVFSPGGMKTGLFRQHPKRMESGFMEPDFVAGKIMEHIRSPDDEWHVILKKKGKVKKQME